MNSAEITGLGGNTVVLLSYYITVVLLGWHYCGITIVLRGSVSSYCHAQFTSIGRERRRKINMQWEERTHHVVNKEEREGEEPI